MDDHSITIPLRRSPGQQWWKGQSFLWLIQYHTEQFSCPKIPVILHLFNHPPLQPISWKPLIFFFLISVDFICPRMLYHWNHKVYSRLLSLSNMYLRFSSNFSWLNNSFCLWKLWSNIHNTKLTILTIFKCVLVACSTFVLLGNYHHHPSSGLFSS